MFDHNTTPAARTTDLDAVMASLRLLGFREDEPGAFELWGLGRVTPVDLETGEWEVTRFGVDADAWSVTVKGAPVGVLVAAAIAVKHGM